MSGMSDLYEGGGEQKPEGKTVDEEGKEQPSALIPKSLLAGKEFNPGDELVLKIKAIHGDEVEVEYAAEPEKGGSEGEDQSAAEELEGMDQKDKQY